MVQLYESHYSQYTGVMQGAHAAPAAGGPVWCRRAFGCTQVLLLAQDRDLKDDKHKGRLPMGIIHHAIMRRYSIWSSLSLRKTRYFLRWKCSTPTQLITC